ncbi:DNA replication/repair protein RecF [Marinilabiliaceae bacterium JC017]|nr:DNA replication/repair protein RecF [Marinilabiliaceae bacterium JC017]
MHLKQLHLINYKNLEQAELEFSPGINCFVGENGAGKTNLLDSIYYLSFCKSYFSAIDSQNIKHDESFFMMQGIYERHEEEETIYCGIKRQQKKQFKRNKKEYSKLADHIGLLPLVVISPSDEQLIGEGSDQRRKYIDGVVSQYNKSYLEHLMRYNRALVQRNALLKKMREERISDYSMLELWDEQLINLGEKIYNQRLAFIEELVPVFKHYYAFISGGREVVELQYKSHYKRGEFREQLVESRDRDIILGYTTKGIHKDDLELLLGEYSIKKIGSQGQKKTFLIALKLAQYEFLVQHSGLKPILLLDDIFDKLDEGRGNRLIQMVAEDKFNQIFITDTRKAHLEEFITATGKAYKMFNVTNGAVNPE